jgi:inorganic pyrophosphatase
VAFPRPFYRYRPHPWHGLDVGPNPPDAVHAYIELTPFDLVKYEIDKETGYLRVDRPQRTSSQPPSLYGFIPRTYCGQRVGDLSPAAARGDGDPLDICVISERPINRAEVILNARIVGGIQMVDHDEADDKIIAVLANDNIWADAADLGDLPQPFVDRLVHFFRTYKSMPDAPANVSIERVYGIEHARTVIAAAIQDYDDHYGTE